MAITDMGGMYGGGDDGGNMGYAGMYKSMASKTNSSLGMGLGAYQLIKAARLKKRAEGMVSPEDPEQRRLLDEINMRRQNIDTGAAYQGQMRDVNQLGAATMEGLKSVTGGNVGATIAAFGQAQRNTGTNMNKVMEEGARNQQYFTSLGADLTDRIAQRKLDLNMYDKMSALAEAAQMKKAGGANMMAGWAGMQPKGVNSGFNNVGQNATGNAGQGMTGAYNPNATPSAQPGIGASDMPGGTLGDQSQQSIAGMS